MLAVFLWYEFDAGMAHAARTLARAGFSVVIIAAQPCSVEGCRVVVLDDVSLAAREMGDAYPLPQLRFSAAAAAEIVTIIAENQVRSPSEHAYIEFQHRGGAGYALTQRRWLGDQALARTVIAAAFDQTQASQREAHGEVWWDLATALVDQLEQSSLIGPLKSGTREGDYERPIIDYVVGLTRAALKRLLTPTESGSVAKLDSRFVRRVLPASPSDQGIRSWDGPGDKSTSKRADEGTDQGTDQRTDQGTPGRTSHLGLSGPDTITYVIPDAFASHRAAQGLMRELARTLDEGGATFHFVGVDGPLAGSSRSAAKSLIGLIPERLGRNVVLEVLAGEGAGAASLSSEIAWEARVEDRNVIILGTSIIDTPVLLASLRCARDVWIVPSAEHREIVAALPAKARIRWLTDLAALPGMNGRAVAERSEPRVTCDEPALDPGESGGEAGWSAAGVKEWCTRAGESRVVTSPNATDPASIRRATIDVIIPFYNLGRYLPATLESLARQSDRDFSILIVDDGSTDAASVELLLAIEKRGQARVVRKSNGGLSSARNAGIAAARATHTLVLDADDLLHETYVERVRAIATLYPELAVVGTFMRSFVDEPTRGSGGWTPMGFNRDLLPFINFACTASCLLRREVAAANAYDEALDAFEDWELWCRLAAGGHACAILPEFLFYYRMRPDSMFHSMSKDHETRLRMAIAAKHPRLALDPSRPLRLEMAMRHHETAGSKKPRRYELADSVHALAVSMGLGRLWK